MTGKCQTKLGKTLRSKSIIVLIRINLGSTRANVVTLFFIFFHNYGMDPVATVFCDYRR